MSCSLFECPDLSFVLHLGQPFVQSTGHVLFLVQFLGIPRSQDHIVSQLDQFDPQCLRHDPRPDDPDPHAILLIFTMNDGISLWTGSHSIQGMIKKLTHGTNDDSPHCFPVLKYA